MTRSRAERLADFINEHDPDYTAAISSPKPGLHMVTTHRRNHRPGGDKLLTEVDYAENVSAVRRNKSLHLKMMEALFSDYLD